MKKSLPLFLLLIITSFLSMSQVRLGIFGGLQSANVKESNNIPGWDTAVNRFNSARSTFHLGVMFEIPIGNKGLFFQPAIGYTSKGRQYTRYYDSATADVTDTAFVQNTLKLGYIEVPLNITYKMYLSKNKKNSFFISAGPYVSFFYSGTMNVQNRIVSTNKYNNQNNDLLVGNATDKYKTVDFGVNGRAGFEIGSVVLSGFISRGLSNFYTAEYNGTFHHQVVGATLGIWLAKSKPRATTETKTVIIVDRDNDGVPDDKDHCPDIAGSVKYNGCPVPDTDGDGVDDEHDS